MKEYPVIYFASPWFTPEQLERETRLISVLRSQGFTVWSPRENCVCKPDADEKTRRDVFMANCKGINDSDIVFAVTDGKDIGTIWEAGYANGLNYSRRLNDVQEIKIVYYCETLKGNPFNLMLAQSADAVLTDFEQAKDLKKVLEVGIDWGGEIE